MNAFFHHHYLIRWSLSTELLLEESPICMWGSWPPIDNILGGASHPCNLTELHSPSASLWPMCKGIQVYPMPFLQVSSSFCPSPEDWFQISSCALRIQLYLARISQTRTLKATLTVSNWITRVCVYWHPTPIALGGGPKLLIQAAPGWGPCSNVWPPGFPLESPLSRITLSLVCFLFMGAFRNAICLTSQTGQTNSRETLSSPNCPWQHSSWDHKGTQTLPSW